MIFKNISKLKDANFSDILGEHHTKVFINANLCPEFKKILYQLKLAKNAGKIAFYGSGRRGTYAQDTAGGREIRIELESDLNDELGITPDEMKQIEFECRRTPGTDDGVFDRYTDPF